MHLPICVGGRECPVASDDGQCTRIMVNISNVFDDN